ncbi:hypothetical protein Esti_003077 [Eimeria stiedai]
MSFAQLHAAAATAAADTAYLQDVRTVQLLLQQLRRHASVIKALQPASREVQSQHGGPVTFLEDQQVFQLQRQVRCELEVANRTAAHLCRVLGHLQQHVSVAASYTERRERQVCYSRLASSSGQLLRELRDAAEGEGLLLRQYHELPMPEGPADSVEKRQAVLKKGGGEEAVQPLHASFRPRLYSPVDGTLASHQVAASGKPCEVRDASPRGSVQEAKAASTTAVRDTATVVLPADFLGTKETYSWVLLQSGIRHKPLEMQPGALSEPPKANKPVPIFIPDSKIDASVLQEKRDHLAKMNQEIRSIQSLYEQMASFTEEQGEQLDAVDNRMLGARLEAARATRDVTIAVLEERRRKQRRCSFVTIMALLLTVFGYALWVNATP